MTSVQLGAAASTHLFATVGPAGATWLRLGWGALMLVVIGRPRVRTMAVRDLASAAALGVVSAGMALSFSEAIDRMPLATAVAVEFLGPLAVGLLRPGGRSWPPLAFVGVLLVTEPWRGTAGVSVSGLGFAVGSAIGWAAYILLTQRVADRFDGLTGLALSMPTAALAATVFGLSQALPHLRPGIVLEGLGLAVLIPVLPAVLELVALRKLTTSAFGTLMSLEPAIALVVGVVVLHQGAGLIQVVGVLLVTTASAGAARSGRREPSPGPDAPAVPPILKDANNCRQ